MSKKILNLLLKIIGILVIIIVTFSYLGGILKNCIIGNDSTFGECSSKQFELSLKNGLDFYFNTTYKIGEIYGKYLKHKFEKKLERVENIEVKPIVTSSGIILDVNKK